jgi:hypothetical protein
MAEEFDLKELRKFAGKFLRWLGTLDPTWATRIEILRTDKKLDSLQTLGSLAARTLERAEHTVLANHPFFEPGVVAMVDPVCPACGEKFAPKYPGQRGHLNPDCSNKLNKAA